MIDTTVPIERALRTFAHEVALSALFAVGVALAFTMLGAVASGLIDLVVHGRFTALAEVPALAIAVPTFCCAWLWWTLRLWSTSRFCTVVVTTGLGLVTAFANRVVLTTNDPPEVLGDAPLLDRLSAVLRIALRGLFAGDVQPACFRHLGREVADPTSLLWCSLAAVGLATIAALRLRRRRFALREARLSLNARRLVRADPRGSPS